MKVRCRFCEHESGGVCLKKSKAQKPVKIELNKPRSCDQYKEDGLRVLNDYRKREVHKRTVKQVQERNLQVHQAVEQMRKELAERKNRVTVGGTDTLLTPLEGSDDTL